MEDETPTPNSTETPAPAPETPPAGTTETPKPEDQATKDAAQDAADEAAIAEATKVKELPEWAQKLITDVRAEAANNRTRAKSAEEKLANAKTPEDIAAAVAAVEAEKAVLARTLLVTNVAREFDLPSDLAELLKGDDEAALKAHAKTLAKYAGTSDNGGELEGGLSGSPIGEPFDPEKAARNARRRRY